MHNISYLYFRACYRKLFLYTAFSAPADTSFHQIYYIPLNLFLIIITFSHEVFFSIIKSSIGTFLILYFSNKLFKYLPKYSIQVWFHLLWCNFLQIDCFHFKLSLSNFNFRVNLTFSAVQDRVMVNKSFYSYFYISWLLDPSWSILPFSLYFIHYHQDINTGFRFLGTMMWCTEGITYFVRLSWHKEVSVIVLLTILLTIVMSTFQIELSKLQLPCQSKSKMVSFFQHSWRMT